jgi:hypothetical protein
MRRWVSHVLPAFLTSPFPISPETPAPHPRAKIRTSDLIRCCHSAEIVDVFLPSFSVLVLCLVDVHGFFGLWEEGFYFALGFGTGGFWRFREEKERGVRERAKGDGGIRTGSPWYSAKYHRRRPSPSVTVDLNVSRRGWNSDLPLHTRHRRSRSQFEELGRTYIRPQSTVCTGDSRRPARPA